jgi:hypothetical protein
MQDLPSKIWKTLGDALSLGFRVFGLQLKDDAKDT